MSPTKTSERTNGSGTPNNKMETAIYWFRNDLRLDDNPALVSACQSASQIIFVYCHIQHPDTRWDTPRSSGHRQFFLASALADLRQQLRVYGSELLEITQSAVSCLPELAFAFNTRTIFCEEIAAPEEQDEINVLRSHGLILNTTWQSSLLAPAALPFTADALPEVFTVFRHAVENAGVIPPAPVRRPHLLPPLPEKFHQIAQIWKRTAQHVDANKNVPGAGCHFDPRSSFPYYQPAFGGGSTAANAHLQQYFQRGLAHTYKQTRNQLTGHDYSTKFSPWLASGALSARQIYTALKQFEADYGANDSSYWIWFELLWRDFFRLLHLKYGGKLYTAHGLSELPVPSHNQENFHRWCQARTGESLVDAGMAELSATGTLSNRLRQIVASFLIYDLQCDWRAGAAWFEAQLIDYDVYSNQGNWLYIAGRGSDPRNGRRFNIQKQVKDYDSDGSYQRLWTTN